MNHVLSIKVTPAPIDYQSLLFNEYGLHIAEWELKNTEGEVLIATDPSVIDVEEPNILHAALQMRDEAFEDILECSWVDVNSVIIVINGKPQEGEIIFWK